jgi:ABC-2 type transport system permease protein
VLLKILRETWPLTLLFALGLFVAELVLNVVFPQILRQLGDLLERLPFVRDFVGALLGVSIEGELTAQLMQAFVWVHPTVLALLCAYVMLHCTRFPVAEIDRGTVDILLGLPVSRRAIFLCETAGWLAGGVVLLGAAAAGYVIGSRALAAASRPPFGYVLLVLLNLFCVYLAVGGVCYLLSSFSERRGRAISAAFGVVLASFLLTFVAQFWAPAAPFAFLSVLDYYRPANILKGGTVDLRDLAVLLAVGLGGWLGGLEISARRNISTT